MDCCQQEGFCPFYHRELWGKQWRTAHNIDCEQAQHERLKAMLLTLPPMSPPEPRIEAPPQTPQPTSGTPDNPQVEAQQAPAKKRGCGCGKSIKPPTASQYRRK